jgi:hypothetical protein
MTIGGITLLSTKMHIGYITLLSTKVILELNLVDRLPKLTCSHAT